ncbi:MAG TPA: GerAB/ArcD/ProY family transporter [Thermovirgaceae bacterium]|nr:GerAB/ArcD/ProY family transporter [Thermovirgaceae bacterium]
MTKGKQDLLSFGAIAVISAALFSGHFGVGDVIFPPILGKGAGSSWFMAAMGYGIINSLGVLVAYLAVSRQQKTLLEMSSRTLGRAFGVVFTTICMLIIGPVFILPRVSSATHEMAVALFFPNFPLFATLAIFFALNYWVAYNRAQVIDRLGKVLSPALIVFMAVLIIKGVVAPIAAVPATGSENPLADGVLNGYNTMNALGAALFGGWILKELAIRGIDDKGAQSKNLAYIGPIVAFGLLITSTGITYLGATASTVFPDAGIGVYTVMIAEGLLGVVGKAIFALLLAFACFTTSVGLTSTAGDVFQEMSGGKLQYKTIVALSSLVGFGIGMVGLGKIVGYTVPWLMLVYPAIIVLLVGNLFDFGKFKPALQAGMVTAIVLSLGDFLSGMGMEGNFFSTMTAKLPLGGQGLGWLVPAVVAAVVALAVSGMSKKK